MNLRPEFVATINKNVKEAERKSAPVLKPALKKVPTPKGSLSKLQGFNLPDNSVKDRSFFDLAASSLGYHEVLNWIMKKVTLLDVPTEGMAKVDKDSEVHEFDEYRMQYIFREIFTEVQENQMQDFFDLFEAKLSAKVTSVELYLIIAYVASTETLQTLDFLHIFGETIFNSLCGGQNYLSNARVRTFGKLLGVSERKLLNTVRELGVKDESNLSFEEFEMVFYSVFEEMESSLAKSSLTGVLNQKKEHKMRTCKSTCNIF